MGDKSVTIVGTALISSLLHSMLGQGTRGVGYSKTASIAMTMRWWADWSWVRLVSGPMKMTRLPEGAHFAADT